MKTIYKIARTELQTLFYSPIAWLILIIFAFQSGMVYIEKLEGVLQMEAMGYGMGNLTSILFSRWGALFPKVQEYLYLYLPLLTMGLMSRELSSGSIKLLYSSPVTNTQIILGKYLAMMIYCLSLIGILMVYVICSVCIVPDLDVSSTMTGVLGIYLLICAYAAIGLFMSCLTSYQVAAAMGTLALLAGLNYVGMVGQSIALVRDITYWLSLAGRSGTFISGLITSQDVLYFIIVVALFLALAVNKLQSGRKRRTRMEAAGRYIGIVVVAMFLGYISSRPSTKCYYDATATKHMTLTPNSQEIISKLKGDVTITTYSNILDQSSWMVQPNSVNTDMSRLDQYTRFKPGIKMKYVFYYDKANNPYVDNRYPNLNDREKAVELAKAMNLDFDLYTSPEEVKKTIDLIPEGNRYVRLLEADNGKKTFLRTFNDMMVFPSEAEISAAFKRLVMELPKVAFLEGHEERSINREGDRDYFQFAQSKNFRYALINQGFDITTLDLSGGRNIGDDVDIVVIADVKTAISENELEKLNRYIAKGGNLIVLGEPGRQEVMNPLIKQFGAQFMPGTLVQPSENYVANLITSGATPQAAELCYPFSDMVGGNAKVTMPGAVGLAYTEDKGFKVCPIMATEPKGSWNELQTTDFIDGKVSIDSASGEAEKSIPTALALSRDVNGRIQKIIIAGDADCISNSELNMNRKGINASNFSFVNSMFYWLSDGETPVDVRRPGLPDNKMTLKTAGVIYFKILLLGMIPLLLLALGLIIWLRRRGR